MPNCLVVDDSPIIRKVVRTMLAQFDFEVGEADNGRSALDACASRMPDAIILDWNMPVMNGMTFLRALRQMETGAQPTVLLCSTQNDAGHIREALRMGANEYIMKPFDAEILRAKLTQVGLL